MQHAAGSMQREQSAGSDGSSDLGSLPSRHPDRPPVAPTGVEGPLVGRGLRLDENVPGNKRSLDKLGTTEESGRSTQQSAGSDPCPASPG